jgi:hypothetical protein
MNHKLSKTLWGLLAFSPLILFLIGFTLVNRSVPPDLIMKEGELTPFLFIIVGNLYCLLILVIFLIYLGRMEKIDNEKKWLWRGLMFFGNVLAIPIFWYFYIWKENK